MTAYSGIYSSLTGLLGFTTALDVVSNNISNLNTPGFKASDSIFRDLGPLTVEPTGDQLNLGPGDIGQGVVIRGQAQNFSEGQIQTTGTPTDLAINGNGFFVLLDGGKQVFTRAGQFTFDKTGHLVDSTTGAMVQMIDASDNLSSLVINQFQTYPPSATTNVALTGNLSTGSTSAPATTLNLIDVSGAARTLSMTETKSTSAPAGVNSWTVTVTDEKGATLLTGSIQFQGDGSPQTGFNALALTLTTADNRSSTIQLNFGTPGSTSGVTSFSAGTTSTALQVSNSDGIALGGITGISFDQNGVAQIAFSNGKTRSGGQIALASFADPRTLHEAAHSQYAVDPSSGTQPIFGRAGESGFGSIQGGSVELANVDLGQEFANIIVLQRGYQGSSQVLNVSSQLLDTLYKALAGG